MTIVPDLQRLTTSTEIQGNILAPFRCTYQTFVFLSFGNRRAAARRWLSVTVGRVSSTADVRQNAQRTFLNLGLTATGLATLHPEVAADLVRFEAFWSGPLGIRVDESGGLTTTASLLGDVDASDPENWQVGGLREPVDALLTIAADDPETLDDRVRREVETAETATLIVLSRQDGYTRRDDGRSVEHFGFADGISQPGIRDFSDAITNNGRLEDARRPGSPVIAAGEFVLGWPGERRPPARAPWPAPAPWMRNGSFQVFRRLCQNVAGWRENLQKFGSDPEKNAAAAIGRRTDGTPLVPDRTEGEPNNFTYLEDKDGEHTPFYAHIRKMNPRDDRVFRDRSHKILRRGVSFGEPIDEHNADDERGLLFNAYMASIENQFEFLQRRWANDPEFPGGTLALFRGGAGEASLVAGLDPVIGDDATVARQRLEDKIVKQIPEPAFGGFVTTTGAVYAFAPSRSALALLAGDRLLDRMGQS
jgi:Dyp-type peroxidase family